MVMQRLKSAGSYPPGARLPREVRAQHSRRRDWRAVLALGVTVVAWASAFAGIRISLRAYTPEHVALLRYLTASAVLAGYAVLTRMPLPRSRDLPGLALLGTVGIALYNVALNVGELRVPAATASFIVAAAPVFMAVEAMVFLRERVRAWGWLGIAVSFAGVGVIAVGTGHSLHIDPLAVVVLAAAVLQSLYSIGQKPYLRRYTALQVTAYAVWSGTIVLLVFTPGLAGQLRAAPVGATVATLYLGVVPGAIGYASWAYALSRSRASTAASALYLVPAVALLIAWVGLRETPAPLSLVGGALVLVGVITLNLLGKRILQRDLTAELPGGEYPPEVGAE